MHIQRQTETFAYRVATAPTLRDRRYLPGGESFYQNDYLNAINTALSYGETPEAIALWQMSGIPLEDIGRRDELREDDYTPEYLEQVAQGVRDNPHEYTARAIAERNSHYSAEDDDREYNRIIQEINELAQSGDMGGAAELAADMGIPDNELSQPVSQALYENQTDEEDDEDDENVTCPNCGFMSFWEDDMRRHRNATGHGRYLETREYPPSPDEPVENTTDPNAKLKSPWYKKVQHYPSGQLPDEFDKRNLYRDFNFGLPGIATDSPQTYFRTDPDQGIYQINDSRRPLHNPPVGYVHYYADHPNKTVKIQYLDVHPKKRGQGVATALVSALAEDFPDYKINPGTTTSHGTGFVDYMRRNAPGAQERLDAESWNPAPANQLTDNQLREWGVQRRRSPVFARIALHNRQVERRRIAALTQDVVDRLKSEFDEWWKGTGEEVPQVKGAWPGRGAIGHWPTIERFLGEKYPAAFKGFNMGHEEVTPMLDRTVYSGDSVFGDLQPEDDCPACFGYGNSGHPDEDCAVCGGDGWANPDALYDSGSKAVARHGYDPSEIAAGMLLLHNESHPFRGGMSDADQERLVDIFQKRQKMQRDYEERQKGLVTAVNKLLLHAQGVLNAQN